LVSTGNSDLTRSKGSLCNAGRVGVRVVTLLGRRELLYPREGLDQELGGLLHFRDAFDPPKSTVPFGGEAVEPPRGLGDAFGAYLE
jgi:hypothetical protein